MCPLSGVIFFVFQRGSGLVSDLARMLKRLDTLSDPRFSLFERPSGRLGSVTKTPIKQGNFVNFASDRLQRCQILSCGKRNTKGAFLCERAQGIAAVSSDQSVKRQTARMTPPFSATTSYNPETGGHICTISFPTFTVSLKSWSTL